MSAFYSMAETAFSNINRFKYKALAEEGKTRAKLIVWMCEHFDSVLVTILIGYNVFAILISTFSTFLFSRLLSAYIPDTALNLLTSIVMAIVTFLFGDTIPKFIGKRRPEGIANFVVFPLSFFVIVLYPISFLFRMLEKGMFRLFGNREEIEVSEEDFNSAIDIAEEQGLLEENESEIIQATFDFADTTVKEVLTPKSKMKMLDAASLKRERLHEFIQENQFSRIPIYYKDPNKILGVLVVKNYLNAYFQDPRVSYLTYLQKPYFVTPSVKIDDLLEGFRKRHTQIALVRKDNKILGMVTAEDVLEELVGKISENTAKEAKR